MSLDDFKDHVAVSAFGITKAEGHKLGICICCKENWAPKTHSEAGRQEYRISGLCEECFDRILGPEDDVDPALREKGE